LFRPSFKTSFPIIFQSFSCSTASTTISTRIRPTRNRPITSP
jgi:hypothetical protein